MLNTGSNNRSTPNIWTHRHSGVKRSEMFQTCKWSPAFSAGGRYEICSLCPLRILQITQLIMPATRSPPITDRAIMTPRSPSQMFPAVWSAEQKTGVRYQQDLTLQTHPSLDSTSSPESVTVRLMRGLILVSLRSVLIITRHSYVPESLMVTFFRITEKSPSFISGSLSSTRPRKDGSW